jgi:hypothetical protein
MATEILLSILLNSRCELYLWHQPQINHADLYYILVSKHIYRVLPSCGWQSCEHYLEWGISWFMSVTTDKIWCSTSNYIMPAYFVILPHSLFIDHPFTIKVLFMGTQYHIVRWKLTDISEAYITVIIRSKCEPKATLVRSRQALFLYDPEDGGGVFLRNVWFLSDYLRSNIMSNNLTLHNKMLTTTSNKSWIINKYIC